MAREIFVDTSGFYAILARVDDRHVAADRILRQAAQQRRGFVTTDYVLVETANLLKARQLSHLLESFFARALLTAACRVEWTDAERFAKVREFFLKHRDQAWSFTDCSSFVTMREGRLQDALSKDVHFEQAGFVALLK